ncbi:MAG: peptide deformylase [Frankiaceae bacterium]|nr:peptide deformylase [Frankiaceae bacterium]MBV9870971.1 peptide deformylase [Frankiaceae bacterium]
MAEREIRRWGDPVLRTPCDEVTVFDAALAALCDDLLDTVTARDGRAGLAANQIGVGLRAFSWFVDGKSGVVVNPRLVHLDGEQDGDEGCLSLPGLWFPVRRAAFAAVEGVDVAGKTVRVEGTGLLARCLQHECGHLDGQLYIDLLDGDLRRDALRAARRL